MACSRFSSIVLPAVVTQDSSIPVSLSKLAFSKLTKYLDVRSLAAYNSPVLTKIVTTLIQGNPGVITGGKLLEDRAMQQCLTRRVQACLAVNDTSGLGLIGALLSVLGTSATHVADVYKALPRLVADPTGGGKYLFEFGQRCVTFSALFNSATPMANVVKDRDERQQQQADDPSSTPSVVAGVTPLRGVGKTPSRRNSIHLNVRANTDAATLLRTLDTVVCAVCDAKRRWKQARRAQDTAAQTRRMCGGGGGGGGDDATATAACVPGSDGVRAAANGSATAAGAATATATATAATGQPEPPAWPEPSDSVLALQSVLHKVLTELRARFPKPALLAVAAQVGCTNAPVYLRVCRRCRCVCAVGVAAYELSVSLCDSALLLCVVGELAQPGVLVEAGSDPGGSSRRSMARNETFVLRFVSLRQRGCPPVGTSYCTGLDSCGGTGLDRCLTGPSWCTRN